MSALAPHLCAFLQCHLPEERGASVHTCEAYAYCFQLLLTFAAQQLKKNPSALKLEDLSVTLVSAFLKYIEQERGNAITTRNARLAAIKAFFHYLEYRLPISVEQSRQIQAIPSKKAEVPLVDYLTTSELQALLDAPDPSQLGGIRDRAMLHLAFAAGLRVSELVSLRLSDFQFKPEPVVRVKGKGRRERILPLWKQTLETIHCWIAVRPECLALELFLNRTRQPMSRSGFEYILAKHVKQATKRCPTFSEKKISPHVLRHTCAMHTLQATHDVRKVALWLGHASIQSTEIYLRTDPSEKLDALEAMLPPSVSKGSFRVTDKIMAMLAPK